MPLSSSPAPPPPRPVPTGAGKHLGHSSIRLGPFGTLAPPIPSLGPCTEGGGPSGSVGNSQRGCGERPTSKLPGPDLGPGLALGLRVVLTLCLGSVWSVEGP